MDGAIRGLDHCEKGNQFVAIQEWVVAIQEWVVLKEPVAQHGGLANKSRVKLDPAKGCCGSVHRRVGLVDSARAKKHLGLDAQHP